MNRDYSEEQRNAISGQKNKALGRAGQKSGNRRKSGIPDPVTALETEKARRLRLSQAEKEIQNQRGRRNLGKGTLERNPGTGRIPDTRGNHNILIGLRGISRSQSTQV